MNNNISPLDESIEQNPLINLDSQTSASARKHKKQDTTHFEEYKEQNKSKKKDEKAERDKLKVKIAVQLFCYLEKTKSTNLHIENCIISVLELLDYQHYKQHIRI